MLADRIPQIQAALAEEGLDGWLFAAFQNNDPVSLEMLGLAGQHLVSRRCYYLVPATGRPRKLVHRLEPAMLSHLPGDERQYLRWQEHAEELPRLVEGMKRLAAQYSPRNTIPTVSRLDAGTAEVLRGLEIVLVSSAELIQQFVATWSDEQLAGHRRANTLLHEFVLAAFEKVGTALRAGQAINEYDVQKFILDQFERHRLVTHSPPIVGVNEHSADPHYQPTAESSSPIRPDDFLLIDLWAKESAANSVFGDITWCGVCAGQPTDRQQAVWECVRDARDAAADLVKARFPHTPLRGFEVDDACRQVIDAAGWGEYFIHRTGHSIAIDDHGPGANMDNLETHDVRLLAPHTGFSIEPGIYFPGDFGIRSEINIALTADAAEITGAEPQRELLRLLP